MQTLAQILAGVGGNPYQQSSQGINPLLQQQALLGQQGALGGQDPATAAAQPQMQGQSPQSDPNSNLLMTALRAQSNPMALGGMGATAMGY